MLTKCCLVKVYNREIALVICKKGITLALCCVKTTKMQLLSLFIGGYNEQIITETQICSLPTLFEAVNQKNNNANLMNPCKQFCYLQFHLI